jgi:uncharacterized protein with FMN-binding domain
MNRQQKTWIRLILVMSSVVATFLGLQMFILVDIQKDQAFSPVIANATTEVAIADSGSVAGDAPPPTATIVATDPPPPELVPSATATLVPTVVVSSPTGNDVIVASAPLVTITQNQIQTPAAQPILPPVAVLLDSQPITTAQNSLVQNTGLFVDGSYLGDAVQTSRWGTTQVQAIIENGQLVNVEIFQYPNHTDRSARISQGALPSLISEAIQNQSAHVDIVTRATDTSRAFMASLQSALSDATA